MIGKSKSLTHIEEQMGTLSPESYRYKTLEAAKDFKTSWVRLGQHLYTVYKDKLFKDWGYLTFEAYCAKEVGVKQNTAVKLLKSYYFLEKEEPAYLKEEILEQEKPSKIPSYESVNMLRLAKNNENISEEDYDELRDEVLENAKEEGEVKQKVRYLLKTGAKKDEGGEADGRLEAAKRLTTYLKMQRGALANLDIPAKILKKLDELLATLEDYTR